MRKLFNSRSLWLKLSWLAGGLLLVLGAYPPGHTLADTEAVVIAIDSRETMTASETGRVVVNQRLQLSRPLRELGFFDERSPDLWLEILGLQQASGLSMMVAGDRIELQYTFDLPHASPYGLTLPAWSLTTLAEEALLPYTLPLEINRQIDLQVSGFVTDLSAPVDRRWGDSGRFTMAPALQTLHDASIKQTIRLEQPDVVALQALRAGLPPFHLSYVAGRPSPRAALPYRLAMGGILLVSLAAVPAAVRLELFRSPTSFRILNIGLALAGFLAGGVVIWFALASVFQQPLSALTPSLWVRFLENILSASGRGRPFLATGGIFLWYLAFAAIRRAIWTRWAILCLLIISTLYAYGLAFLLLLLPELVTQQRFILTLGMLVFSAGMIFMISTFTVPHPTYYRRDGDNNR